MADKRAVLKKYFGHSDFREGQEIVVDAILDGRDALCVMPTGAGKSICYQLPALLFDGLTLVISPLISLMKDQVAALMQNGIPAAYINSSLSPSAYHKALEVLRAGGYKLVYVAPERLLSFDFLSVCRTVKISLLAVDEAHCISQWGQDFRPGYLKIAEFVTAIGQRPAIAAFTATATEEVKADIEHSLGLRSPLRITTGFDRPNLSFSVIRGNGKPQTLVELISARSDISGIVYCATRSTVEKVCELLCRKGFSATMYHAGLDSELRRSNQEAFVYDRVPIMVATNAFGMGIDKSNVGFVIHYNMPQNMEGYYQEAGRAGRDGEPAECIMLYSPSDVRTARYLIEHSEPNPELTPDEQALYRERAYDRLSRITFYATGNTCLRSSILSYFGEKTSGYCGNCSNCRTQYEETDVTVDAQKILSCIVRTKYRYGKKMICDILRGSRNERLLQLGLDSQTTYGLMSDYTERRVRDIMDFLEYEGYLRLTEDPYPALMTTSRSADVLYGKKQLVAKLPKDMPKGSAAKKASDESVGDPALLAKLKKLRLSFAEKKHIPAYVVFTDHSLKEMCRLLPVTPTQLLRVSGVGNTKYERYGEAFLSLIREHMGYEVGKEEEQSSRENIGDSRAETRKRKLPFAIDPEKLAAYQPSDEPITLEMLAERINALAAEYRMRKFTVGRVLRFLVHHGYFAYEEKNGKRQPPVPTSLGMESGFSLHIYMEHRFILCDRRAQELILRHHADIMRRGRRGENDFS